MQQQGQPQPVYPQKNNPRPAFLQVHPQAPTTQAIKQGPESNPLGCHFRTELQHQMVVQLQANGRRRQG